MLVLHLFCLAKNGIAPIKSEKVEDLWKGYQKFQQLPSLLYERRLLTKEKCNTICIVLTLLDDRRDRPPL
ncbi:MAG: hypothetical protein Q8Q56_01960, partial [Alphaproteobacteria bacterium]|nr:hypothetical protein [Alphaproteobacteria bacterium]